MFVINTMLSSLLFLVLAVVATHSETSDGVSSTPIPSSTQTTTTSDKYETHSETSDGVSSTPVPSSTQTTTTSGSTTEISSEDSTVLGTTTISTENDVPSANIPSTTPTVHNSDQVIIIEKITIFISMIVYIVL